MPKKIHDPWRKVEDGEWIQPRHKKFYLVCCDCGLVHRMRFRIVKRRSDGRRRVQFTATRAPRLTARLRKARGWT